MKSRSIFDIKEKWLDYIFRYLAEQTSPIYAKRYLEIKKVDWRLTKINQGDLILDVGSGKPIDAIRAVWHGAFFIALDLSRQDLVSGRDFMKRELPHLSLFADFLIADAAMLPFKNSAFNLTISYSAIEHVESCEKHERWASEMARVTKVGGKVVMTTENKLNFLCFFLHPFQLIDYKKIQRPMVLNVPAAFFLFWLSRRFRLCQKLVPLKNDLYVFFTPHQLMELLINVGLKPTTFDSNTLYYWGYGPPLLAFSNIALKMDSLVQRLENVKCLRIFGERMGFCCIKE